MAGRFHIRSVIGRILMSRIMGEFYQRQSAAVIHLGRKHKPDLVRRHLRSQMDHPLNILHGIAVSISIAQPAVRKGRCTGPDKRHEAVVGVPCIDHDIKLRTGRLYPEMRQLLLPVTAQMLKLLPGPACLFITAQDPGCLIIGSHSENKCQTDLPAGCQRDLRGKRSAGIFIVAACIAEIPADDPLRVSVIMISAQKFFFITAPGIDPGAGQPEEAFFHSVPAGSITACFVQVSMNTLYHAVLPEKGAGDVSGILQIHKILLIIAVIGKLSIAGDRQLSFPFGSIAHTYMPYLPVTTHRHIPHRIRTDPAIGRTHTGISQPVPAFAGIFLQRFPHRLPGCRPEVPVRIVSQIDIPARPVRSVKLITKNPAVCPRLHEAVPAGII